MQYFLLIASIVLYLVAPTDSYSLKICIYAFTLFLLGSVWGIYRLQKVEFFGFNLLFTISFFGCCYIFPIFIYNTDDAFSLFYYGYDYKVITKTTCMASIAYSCYLCGLLQRLRNVVMYKVQNVEEIYELRYAGVNANSTTLVSVLFLVTFLMFGGYSYLNKQYEHGDMGGGMISYLYVLVTLIPILLTYSLNCQFRNRHLLVAVLFSALLLTTGSRTHPLSVLLGIFYVFTFRKKIPVYLIILLLLVGLVAMAFFGATRGGQELEMNSEVGFWGAFLDLIVNNRNLYDAYSLVQTKGHIPTVLFGPILAVVPLGQSLFCMLTGTPPNEMRSSLYITMEHFGENPPLGLGTNVVGDVYLGGGLIVVVILFYFLGRLITRSLYGIHVKKNINWYIFYVTLVVNAVFICRGSFFLFLRPFVWTMIVLWIIRQVRVKRV